MAWGVPQGIRAAGAARALGAPKGGKPAGRPKAPAGKPPKMPTAHHAPPRAPQHMPTANAHQPKSWLEMNPAQLHHFATKQVQQSTHTELEPLKAQAGQIQNIQNTTQQKYAGYGQATQSLLGGIQSGAEGSAKTFANQAAESALQARKQVESAGQNTQAQNGGYLDPQVAQALGGQSAFLSQIGAGRTAGAESQGQNETNYLTSLRAAAGQRALEGQQGIASTYGKQLAQNQTAQQQVAGRQTGSISKLETELAQKQFTNRATEQGLGIKIGGLKVNEANAATKAKAVKASERGQSLSRRSAQERNEISRSQQSFNQWATREKINLSGLGADEKKRVDDANIRYKQFAESHGGKVPSQKEGRAYMSKLSTAEAIARQALGNQRQGSQAEKHAREEQVRKDLAAKGANGDVISAALNLAVYGRLGPVDQHVAESYGLTRNTRPQWFRKG